MAGKYFGIPFALSGDRSAIPDAAQPDGSVSFTQGFTLDYELENTDPNYKPVPREETNALYYDITEAIGIVQKQGFADWTIAAAPYPINAFVRHNDIVWRNTVAGNSAEPGTDSSWIDETISFIDTINAPIATVAAAGTINLTTGAPDTSQIAISGTGVSINGFTVAANRFFVVKMTGSSNTLVNSASLVTGRGANIPVVAGDCFLMRSTAANTVEIVGGLFLVDRSVGSGKSYVNLTGSRSLGAVYTNTTGRDLLVSVSTLQVGSAVTDITVGGVFAARAQASTSGEVANATAIVPNGQEYSVNAGNTLYYWGEL